MDQRYVLAYDLGTSGVKCALVTPEGILAACATTGYGMLTPKRGWAEQSPENYWSGVCHVTKEVLQLAGVSGQQVIGIAFGTLWKGIIPIDSEGNVLRPSILWLDGRAVDQARRLNEFVGVKRYSPTDYWPKLLWLRENEPETINKAAMILEVNSYLKWKATGKATVDISNCYTTSFDETLDAYYERLFAFMDIPREKFPKFVESSALVGHITQQAAQELGVVPGTPVFGGNNDIQGVTVGSGCSTVGGVHIYFGSSGWMGFTLPHTKQSYGTPFDQKRDIFLAGMRAIGLSLNWVAKKLYSKEYEQMGDNVFALMDREAAQIPAGCGGLLATPWLYGEHPPLAGLDAGGCFLNLKPDHGRGHMTRAMMECICFHLKQRTQYFCHTNGCEWPVAVNVVGGGACSDVWMQILADVLNVPVRVPATPRHAGAIGTAYSAIIGLGLCNDYDDAARKLHIDHILTPNADAVAVYEKQYGVYTQLYGVLQNVFLQLNEIR